MRSEAVQFEYYYLVFYLESQYFSSFLGHDVLSIVSFSAVNDLHKSFCSRVPRKSHVLGFNC